MLLAVNGQLGADGTSGQNRVILTRFRSATCGRDEILSWFRCAHCWFALPG